MKNLDLNKYGVQELNVMEIEETIGGGLLDYAIEAWYRLNKYNAQNLARMGDDAMFAALQYN